MSSNDNLHSEESPDLLDKNLSRLLKLAKVTEKPDKAFIDSLIANAIGELKRSEVKGNQRKRIIPVIGWLEKTVGWAAMFAAAVGAGMVSIVSMFFQLNSILAAANAVTVFVNWLNYFKGIKL